MKRGTLLLALALLLQGSTTWGVLGDTSRLTKAQKRSARRARKKALAAQAATEEQPADDRTLFEMTFGTAAVPVAGPAARPADYVSDDAEDGKAEADDLAASVHAEIDAAVAAAIVAADASDDNGASSEVTADVGAGAGWFDTLLGAGAAAPTDQELAAQAQAQQDTAAAQLKAEQETTAAAFIEWQGTDGVKDVVGAIKGGAQAMQAKRKSHTASLNKVGARFALVHPEMAAAAAALQQRLAAKPLQDPYAPVATEYDSEYSDVEGQDTQEYPGNQVGYSSWTQSLRNPQQLLAHLQKESIEPQHRQHFETLVAAAISTLIEQSEGAMTTAPTDDVASRRVCVQANALRMQTLNDIAKAARLKSLNLTRASKHMVFAFQQTNDAYVARTAHMATKEITGTRVVLNDDDFRLPTAARVLARAKRTKHERLQGAEGTDNLAVITRAIASLTQDLIDGTADLTTVASALDLLNSPKGIHVAPHVVKDLHAALTKVATQNSEMTQTELEQAVALNTRLSDLAEQVGTYAERFTADDITEAEADTAFLEDVAVCLPADDEGDAYDTARTVWDGSSWS